MNPQNETIPFNNLNKMPDSKDIGEARKFSVNHSEDFLQFFSKNLLNQAEYKTV